MRWIGQVIGGLVVLGSAVAIAVPGVLLARERAWLTPGVLYVVAALRIGLGTFFVFAARVARVPWAIRLLGILVIVAGLITPWFGVARTHALVDWWAGAGWWQLRLTAGVAMALGGFLVYAFRPPSR